MEKTTQYTSTNNVSEVAITALLTGDKASSVRRIP
jgi:hypothetical protein